MGNTIRNTIRNIISEPTFTTDEFKLPGAMGAAVAKLTFPNFQEVLDVQDKEIEYENTRKKFYDYLTSSIDLVPDKVAVLRSLLKYVWVYAISFQQNDTDPIDKKIERHIGQQLYSSLSAEFGEIQKQLQLSEVLLEAKKLREAHVHMNNAIARCGVLLKLFLSNLRYGIPMAMLFKNLCLAYIGLGLAVVRYDTIYKNDIINRFNEIENAVDQFKKEAVRQRLNMITQRYNDALNTELYYIDTLTDIKSVTAFTPNSGHDSDHSGRPINLTLALWKATHEQKQEYERQLEVIYNNYFDRIKSEALNPAKNVLYKF